jgi:hypothetical protein
MTNDKGQISNSKSQIPNSKTQAGSELERDDVGIGGSETVVDTGGIESGGHGRLDARLKGVRRRKRARSGSGSDVLTRKIRLVKAVEECDTE